MSSESSSEVVLPIHRGYQFEADQDYIGRLAVCARERSLGDPQFGRYPILQLMNLMHIENELVRVQTKYDQKSLSHDDLDTLTQTLKTYFCALRDLEFITNLKRVHPKGEVLEKKWREERLGSYLKDQEVPARFTDDYITFRKPTVVHSDRLMEFISRHLPKRLAWSRSERLARRAAFDDENAKPLGFSLETRLITCVCITTLAAAWLITPIVLMTIPTHHVSKAWDLSTMSIAIVLFGAFVSLVVGTQASSREVITSTAAYAAVLVIFYGNVADRSS